MDNLTRAFEALREQLAALRTDTNAFHDRSESVEESLDSLRAALRRRQECLLQQETLEPPE